MRTEQWHVLPKVVVRMKHSFVFEVLGAVPSRLQAAGAHCHHYVPKSEQEAKVTVGTSSRSAIPGEGLFLTTLPARE